MIKKVNKQRIVEFQEHDIFCDLCEALVPVGAVMITLVPQIAETNGNTHASRDHLQICSVDCLVNKAAAAGLILNTNVFPALRNEMSRDIGPRPGPMNYDILLKEMSNKKEYSPYRKI